MPSSDATWDADWQKIKNLTTFPIGRRFDVENVGEHGIPNEPHGELVAGPNPISLLNSYQD